MRTFTPENPATLQEVFDISVNHLRRQGVKSIDWNGMCRYRLYSDDHVFMCAAGPLIPDVEYHTGLEGKNAYDIDSTRANTARVVARYLCWPEVPMSSERPGGYLIHALQQCHDYTSPGGWERNWQRIAAKFDLIYTPPIGWGKETRASRPSQTTKHEKR